jgi:hypothetical protein
MSCPLWQRVFRYSINPKKLQVLSKFPMRRPSPNYPIDSRDTSRKTGVTLALQLLRPAATHTPPPPPPPPTDNQRTEIRRECYTIRHDSTRQRQRPLIVAELPGQTISSVLRELPSSSARRIKCSDRRSETPSINTSGRRLNGPIKPRPPDRFPTRVHPRESMYVQTR